ncbi:MAG TPA: response regulator transcription factor [Bacteroidota bacterium]|jgi:DNA-binding NarL/FixJ family response regulator|nr:response regulator transcription factor [Bacteroidota bacterium]
MNSEKKYRILIADDHRIVREGLRSVLEKESNIEVIGETGDGNDAVRIAKKRLPDIVIMDVSMPNLNGIEATRQITEEIPEVRVIILSMHVDKHLIFKAFHAGARAYLLKDSTSQELLEAIEAVSRNRIYVSPALGFDETRNVNDATTMLNRLAYSLLTPKELEVLQLVAEGKPSKDIADRLRVSPKTVEKHRLRIMEKLNIHSVAELTKFAIREGVTSVEK